MAFIGIDLGTTTSEAAVFKNGRAQLIRDRKGKEITLSVVGINPKTKELEIGDGPFNQLAQYPDLTVEEIKRKMGQDTRVKLGDRELRPEEISAILLRKIKEYAEAFLGETVERAVITVPANFNDQQRGATKVAGEMAGLKVERIVNEPTAAALAFGADAGEQGKILVYDLGGGTFDVTVLEQMSGVLDVKSSAGDNQLGGKDFDRELAKWAAKQFLDETGVDITDDASAMAKLKQACEVAKKELSFSDQATISVPFIITRDGKPLSLEIEAPRDVFENLIGPYLERTKKAIGKALRDASLEISDIDAVLLVGGSTRIPAVRNLVKDAIAKEPRTDIDPDRAVALGAAIQASIIDGESDAIIMDVCPLSLGTSVVTQMNGQMIGGVYAEVLPANTPQLQAKTESFSTVHDDQSAVNIDIFQKDSLSDSIWCRDHTMLHSQVIEGLTPMPAGQESISLTYTYNLDGMLDVLVKVKSTGKEEKFSVETNLRNELSTEAIDDLWEKSDKASKVRATILSAEKAMRKHGDHPELKAKIDQLKAAVVDGNDALIDKLDEEITDLVFDLS
jgi:molecular chaperone DnaK